MDSRSPDEIERRKGEHLALAADGDVTSRQGSGWEDIHLVHQALPSVDHGAVDLRTPFFGRELKAPLLIAGMTGGHARAAEVNAILARAAERHGVAMGVGSQRASVRRPDLVATYSVARQTAPTAVLVGNVGAPQLIPQGDEAALDLEQIRPLVESLRADALAVHLNYLQETVQPEGDRRAEGVLAAIEQLTGALEVPVIAKETGAGLSRESARKLASAGVRALDVGGRGGTSFAAVESLRARARGDEGAARLGEVFRDWGIPTAVSVAGCVPTGLPVIATGGVRSGLDAAKALSLGARLVGVARPLLQMALERGDAGVDAWIRAFLAELRAAVFLCGVRSSTELRFAPLVVLGETRGWLEQLGYLDALAGRSAGSF